MSNKDLALPSGRAVAASPSSPQAVSPVPASIPSAEDALRSLASYVGAGGYNALSVDPALFESKIRWGIDYLINATIQRCADVIEEQSKNYARATWGSARRAILDLKAPVDAAEGAGDWRIGQIHVELEHLVVSAKGGELYCELCKQLVGEDGTMHPATCPLSYGYDHLRVADAQLSSGKSS